MPVYPAITKYELEHPTKFRARTAVEECKLSCKGSEGRGNGIPAKRSWNSDPCRLKYELICRNMNWVHYRPEKHEYAKNARKDPVEATVHSSCEDLTEVKYKSKDSAETEVPFRMSLFPFVAPYISFRSFDGPDAEVPPEVAKHLKFVCSNQTASVVKNTLIKSGFSIVDCSEEWVGAWGLKRLFSTTTQSLKPFQKVNTIPGISQFLGRKDNLWLSVKRMIHKFGSREFGFMPLSYVIPHEREKLRRAFVESQDKMKWILKPPSANCGVGIKVVSDWWEIPKGSLLVQQYLSAPKLINEVKFHLRLYVLMTSLDPLRLYLYNEGLVKFATAKYIDDMRHLKNRFMHLTNYCVNKQNKHYRAAEGFDDFAAHKWSLSNLLRYLATDGVDTKALWVVLKDIIVKTVISTEPHVNQTLRNNLSSRYSSYELLGFDVLLDEKIKPWLLEVNITPTLGIDSMLDSAVKGPLVRNVFNVASFQIPNNLSSEELSGAFGKCGLDPLCQDLRLYETNLTQDEVGKQAYWLEHTKRSEYLELITKDLKPDDLRLLIHYEDELTQLDRFEKIFPTTETHKYFKYFETPRYYNMLLNAWEETCGDDRRQGIDRIKELCRDKYHMLQPTAKLDSRTSLPATT